MFCASLYVKCFLKKKKFCVSLQNIYFFFFKSESLISFDPFAHVLQACGVCALFFFLPCTCYKISSLLHHHHQHPLAYPLPLFQKAEVILVRQAEDSVSHLMSPLSLEKHSGQSWCAAGIHTAFILVWLMGSLWARGGFDWSVQLNSGTHLGACW